MRKQKHHRRLDVVVAGLAVVDIIGKPVNFERPPKKGGLQIIDTIKMTTGGNVSNVGIDLSKLGFHVGAITRIGSDGLGRVLLQEYEECLMDCTGVILDEQSQTSATFVSVDEQGERTFLHTRGAMANFRPSDVEDHLALIKRARFLVFGYLGLLPELESDLPALLRTIKMKSSVDILLDTGGVPQRLGKDSLKSLLSSVDYFIPSLEEAVALTGEKTPETIVEFLLEFQGPKAVGVKLGEQGCYVATRSAAHRVPAARVDRVVDTTGAGDAFVSGFAAAILKGMDPFQAARIGNAVAASCVTALGASTAIRPFKVYA